MPSNPISTSFLPASRPVKPVSCQQGLSLMKPEQVLYMDTGSTIYKRSAGLPELPTVSYLGQFTDELTEKDTIVEFAAAGPKN